MKVLLKKHIVNENKIVEIKLERYLLENLNHPFLVKLHCAF